MTRADTPATYRPNEPPLNRWGVSMLLSQLCTEAGGIEAWGRPRGLSRGYIADVIAERRPPGDRIMQALGLRRVEMFERIRPAATGDDLLGTALGSLLQDEARALLWLPNDGSPRDRRVRDGRWRPGSDLLHRLARLGLAEQGEAGWSATAAGLEGAKRLREGSSP